MPAGQVRRHPPSDVSPYIRVQAACAADWLGRCANAALGDDLSGGDPARPAASADPEAPQVELELLVGPRGQKEQPERARRIRVAVPVPASGSSMSAVLLVLSRAALHLAGTEVAGSAARALGKIGLRGTESTRLFARRMMRLLCTDLQGFGLAGAAWPYLEALDLLQGGRATAEGLMRRFGPKSPEWPREFLGSLYARHCQLLQLCAALGCRMGPDYYPLGIASKALILDAAIMGRSSGRAAEPAPSEEPPVAAGPGAEAAASEAASADDTPGGIPRECPMCWLDDAGLSMPLAHPALCLRPRPLAKHRYGMQSSTRTLPPRPPCQAHCPSTGCP